MNTRQTSQLLVLSAIFCGMIASVSAEEPGSIPKVFRTYIGGFQGTTYVVELHDQQLFYTAYDGGLTATPDSPATPAYAFVPTHCKHGTAVTLRITPTPEHWREFRRTLDELKIWRWPAFHQNDQLADGNQWLVELEYPDQRVKSRGTNRDPDDSGQPHTSRTPAEREWMDAFNRYLGAVQKLVGQTFQ